MIEALAVFIPVGILLLLGFGVGTWREQSHLRDLAKRQSAYDDMLVTNQRIVPDQDGASKSLLVMGEAVIATDYFKTFLASFKNIIGGDIQTYETLLQRARWEATLRMLDEARRLGATEVWNVRYDTSNITSATRNNPAVSVEVLAFGTAVVRKT